VRNNKEQEEYPMTVRKEDGMTSGTRRVVIHLPINYAPVFRDDYWAALVEQFGLTAYASTQEELEDRIEAVIREYLEGFGKDTEKALNYFNRHGIRYSVEFDPPNDAKRESSGELTIQVPT
jgi:predicted RNase H-like HicB family nuclease